MSDLRRSPWGNGVDARAATKQSSSIRGRPLPPRLQSLLVAALSLAYFLTFPLAIGGADESQLLYGAKRILDGQVIYKDFFEILPPLSFYLFAGIYRVAGTTLLAARVGIALIEALGCALLFQLVRRVSGMLEATLATLIFAGICVPTWPYASPHWISTVLGLLVATVTLAECRQRSTRVRPLVAGMLAGVAVCVQQQRGVFLAAWLPLALCVLGSFPPRPTRWRTIRAEIAWGAGGGAIILLLVLGQATWASSPRALVDALYEFPTSFYPVATGSVHWAGVLPLTRGWLGSTWLWLLWIAPVFLLGDGVLLIRNLRRSRERSELEHACLWLLALLMGLSVWYLPDFIHVSFVLPFLLVLGARLLHGLRSTSLWARMPAGSHAVTAGLWILLVAVVGRCAANVEYAYAIAPERIETNFGPLRVDADKAQLFRAVDRHLAREPDGRRLLYSYPDDAWLYLALPADDATRFDILFPGFPQDDMQEATDVLQARRPGTIVLWMPMAAGPIGTAIAEGYDAVEEVARHRIYVRRGMPGPPPSNADE